MIFINSQWVLLPQFIATVSIAELGAKVGEVSEQIVLTDALDMVFRELMGPAPSLSKSSCRCPEGHSVPIWHQRDQ